MLLNRWFVGGDRVRVATTYTRSQLSDTFQYLSGDRTLVRQRDGGCGTGAAQQRDLVGVMLETDVGRADVVGDDEVEVLAPQLRLGVGHDIGGFGGEADQQLPRALARTEPGEDVGRRFEHDLGRTGILLHLAGLDDLRPE